VNTEMREESLGCCDVALEFFGVSCDVAPLGWRGLICNFSLSPCFLPCSSQSLYAMERDSKQYKSFPCTHPNCHRTFLSASGRTQHWNATHREITPASEPDPELQFTRHFHPKLNGKCVFDEKITHRTHS
jgi:hypothetical protein